MERKLLNPSNIARFFSCAILALSAITCAPTLYKPSPVATTNGVGFVGRSSFRVKSALGASSVNCVSANPSTTVIATLNTDGWYYLDSLLPNTTYAFTCATSTNTTAFQVRTLSNNQEAITPTGQFVQGGVTYGYDTCFTEFRNMSYNSVTGSLDLVGQHAGSAMLAPNTCFATYDGMQWKILRLANQSENPAATVDYNSGDGMVYLPDGTTVVRDTQVVGGNRYNRLNFCKSNCGTQSSWTSLLLTQVDNTATLMNPCTASISVNPQQTKIALMNGCGTADYTQCALGSDCTKLTNWSTPIQIQGADGSGRYPSTIWDRDGGLWFTAANAKWLLYCASTSDCTTLAGWKQGQFSSGNNSPQFQTYFEMVGSQIRVVTALDSTVGPSTLSAAVCDLDGGTPCGIVNGANVYTSFQVVTFSVPNQRLAQIRKTTNGYHYGYLDSGDAMKTKEMICRGNFASCFASLAAWSSPLLMPDGLSHIWMLYMERDHFVDSNGQPAVFATDLNGVGGVLYFSNP